MANGRDASDGGAREQQGKREDKQGETVHSGGSFRMVAAADIAFIVARDLG